MTDIREIIKKKRLLFDGGAGTYLSSKGLPPGVAPEVWNTEHPELITDMHREYIKAGADILTANTFGVNADKYGNYENIIKSAISCAKSAAENKNGIYIAYDMGPTGRLLSPLGELDFEDAVKLFRLNAEAAERAGADLILIETMSDSYETKAAILGAREGSSLPVFVTNAYGEDGKLMTGASPEAMAALIEGLGADAIGVNCSFGPDKMLDIVKRLRAVSSLPIIASPNAGLPRDLDGRTVYDISPDKFARYMRELAEAGANILGGCCGTTPEYIEMTADAVRETDYIYPEKKDITLISSYTHALRLGEAPLTVGERINPTGKRAFKEALIEGNIGYILREAISEEEAGADILDVNLGLPEIDEGEMMERVIRELQAVSALPLQIDTSDPSVMARAMRIYNGKPLVNSVNGEYKKMHAIFPLVKKYGGAVIALTMDENGIPDTVRGRLDIAERIIDTAAEYGIGRRDIIFDPLALSVSALEGSAEITLATVRALHGMGLLTSLGISNISFGLPMREAVNSVFLADALTAGLDLAIINPASRAMTDVIHAHSALHLKDPGFEKYISYALGKSTPPPDVRTEDIPLRDAITKGLSSDASRASELLLAKMPPLDIISGEVIPALNEVGQAYEEGRVFLPQLLRSAEAATDALSLIKKHLPKGDSIKRGGIILATVKGDIHDIGKNIVKAMLESYGFEVTDLGRDVPSSAVLSAVKERGIRLVGLSALMTSTVPAMEETVRLLHALDGDIRVIVGGAVLTPEYAERIGADHYAPDAMATVRYTEEFYK